MNTFNDEKLVPHKPQSIKLPSIKEILNFEVKYNFINYYNIQKRFRRKYSEIDRIYKCTYLNCIKAYGTLNHLNAHITMQKHGKKKVPSDFKFERDLIFKNY